MDNWVLMSKKMLVNKHTDASQNAQIVLQPDEVKVKVSHFLVTDFDSLVYTGVIEAKYPKTIGHSAIGVVNETGSNVYSCTKGQRVILLPSKACGKCYACKTGHPERCASPILAGKDYDGFLRDIMVCKESDVMYLPETIDDVHGLCVEAVGIAEAIYDRLKLNAGDKVTIIGMGFYGNMIAQTLMYHKVIPIAVDNNPENLRRSERAGVVFNFMADDELTNNIKTATCGSMCSAAIYCAASRLSPNYTARVCAPGSTVILTAPSGHESFLDVHQILNNNLTVTAISNAYGYMDNAVRLLQNKAINIDFYEKMIVRDESYDPVAILEERDENSSKFKANKLTIIQTVI